MSSVRARAAAALAVLTAGAAAHVPFRTDGGDVLHWNSGGANVSFVLQAAGSADVGDASDDLALRLAFAEWSSLAGSSLSLLEDDDLASRARTDWEADDSHLVLFDETDASGFFPGGSGILAITPVQFNPANGRIVDADILFNGKGFSFSTDLSPGSGDVWGIATHEVGHLVGFDHNVLGGASLLPTTAPAQIHPRILHDDDRAGAAATYPQGSTNGGTLTGKVRRASGGAELGGACVWARDAADGRARAQTLTDQAGRYTLRGLPTGSYVVLAAPLDGPVFPGNFPLPGVDIETDFDAVSIGPVAVSAGGSTAVGDLLVPARAANNPNSITPLTPLALHPGQTLGFLLGTGGVVSDATIADPGGFFLTSWVGSVLTVTASPSVASGLYDVELSGPTGSDFYPGWLEVLPGVPAPESLSPALSGQDGERTVTLTGEALGSAPLVIFGDALGTDVVVSEEGSRASLTVVVPPHAPGVVDVVVVNEAGEEGRLVGGFTYVDGQNPTLASAFPGAGTTAGGSAITLLGSDFERGAAVTFGGLPAASVTFVDSGRLRATTPVLGAGRHDVEVTNPAGPASALPGAFLAVAAPDPSVTEVLPGVVTSYGGEALAVLGSGFVAGAEVLLGADPDDGSGGTPAPVTFDDGTQLAVVTPALGPGAHSLLVRLPSGQAAFAPAPLEVAPVLLGKDTLVGTIADGTDVDLSFLEGLPGTRLSARAKRGKGSGLQPVLALRGPDGKVLLSSDPGDPAFDRAFVVSGGATTKLVGVVLADLGRYTLALSGMDGSTGDYKLSIQEKLSPEVTRKKLLPQDAAAVSESSPLALEWVAKSGSTLSGSLASKDGAHPVVASLTGPSGDVSNDPTVVAAVSTNASGTKLHFRQVPLAAFGEYLLSVGSAEGSGTLQGTLRIKPPKSKVKYLED